jgi:hypothetical protein
MKIKKIQNSPVQTGVSCSDSKHSFESANKCLIIKKIRRFIPDYELLADLCCTALRLRAFTVSIRQYQRLGEFNPSTLIARFGSWNRACELVGLAPVKTIRPEHTELMANLAAVWRHLGRQPKLAEMTSRISKFSRHAYINRYGSWYKTLTEFEKWINTTPQSPPNIGGEHKSGGGGLKRDNTTPQSPPKLGGEQKSAAGFSSRYPGLRLRMEVLKRDRYKCRLCGRSPAQFHELWLEIDHIMPWSSGGKTEIGNMQTLCNECNRGKGDVEQLIMSN